MGYDLHITRTDDWVDSDTHAISLEEWAAYVAADPEMRMDGFAEVEADGHIIRVENDGLAVWIAYSEHGKGSNMVWFDYRNGRIVVKNPNEEIIGKMTRIAERLGARIQGDDGEWYPDVTPIVTGRPSLFTNPLISFVLSVGALVALALAIPIDSLLRQQYPVGTPMPLTWAAVVAVVGVIGVLCWLTGIVFALMSLVAHQQSIRFERSLRADGYAVPVGLVTRSQSMRFAWAALVVSIVSLCVFLLPG